MNKLNINRLAKTVAETLLRRSPEILTGIGIAGTYTTTILAVKSTPKALELIEVEKRRRKLEHDKYVVTAPDDTVLEPMKALTTVDMVKIAWKPYVPAIVSAVFSTACLIGATSVHARRNAALATAYKLSETALMEYREKVVETIGEKKEQTVRDGIAKDRIEKDPMSKTEVVVTERGNTLCYDAISGRYFKSDIEQIKKVINALNKRMLSEMYISLNELYSELGLPGTSLGNELGWSLNDGLIEIDFSAQIADDGTPCIAVDYMVAPRYDYSKLR